MHQHLCISRLKKSQLKLDLLANIDILVEKEITDGICHAVLRCAKAYNKCMKIYNKNKKSFSLKNWDENNLHGWAISQKLPLNGFKWVEQTTRFNDDFIKKLKWR